MNSLRRVAGRPSVALILGTAALLAGCGAKTPRGVFAHGNGPNEFVVGRAAPLVVPPDFALVPPRPGAPRAQDADSSTQALDALYGGRQRASAGEAALLGAAGAAPEAGIRSSAGGGATVVNKGAATRDIVAAPTGDDAQASATTTAPAPTASSVDPTVTPAPSATDAAPATTGRRRRR